MTVLRRWTLVCAGVVAASLSLRAQTAPLSPIAVSVGVVDAAGVPIDDIAPSDVSVLVDKKLVTLTGWQRDDSPISVVLMLDRSGSSLAAGVETNQVALAVIDQLRLFDPARLVEFADNTSWRPDAFTADRQVLRDVLRHPMQGNGTRLWDAALDALNALGAQRGFKAVVLVSDGNDEGSRKATSDAIKRRAAEAGVWFNGIGETSMILHTVLRPSTELLKLARDTGGVYVELPSPSQPSKKNAPPPLDPTSAVSAMFTRLHHRYHAEFSIPYTDGRLHDLNVRVARPGAVVSAAKWCPAPKAPTGGQIHVSPPVVH